MLILRKGGFEIRNTVAHYPVLKAYTIGYFPENSNKHICDECVYDFVLRLTAGAPEYLLQKFRMAKDERHECHAKWSGKNE